MMTMVISGSDGVTFPDSTNQFSGGAFSFKNRLINGGMVIDQRNAGGSLAQTNGAYNLDRWFGDSFAGSPVTGKYTVQQNAGSVTPPAGFTNYLGVTSTATTADASTNIFCISQKIEGLNTADLGWGTANAKTVTLSFWVRSSLTGTFGGSVKNSASNRSYPFTYSISAANTWEQKSVTIAGDTSGTWVTNNGVGIWLNFGIGAGSTFSGTAGSWNSNNNVSATGAVSVVGTNGATWYVTGVQLEVGSVATPFERRPYGLEFMLCQRYYQRYTGNGTNYGPAIGYGLYNSATEVIATFQFPVQMRTSSTFSYSLLSDFDLEPFDAEPTALATFSHAGAQFHSVTATDPSSRTQGFGALICCDVNGGWFAFSAEL
jgi:hypothetical protein